MVKNRGRQLEDTIIKDLGAKPHKNSGAMHKKLDGSDDDYVYEVKTTGSGQYIFKRSDWLEVNRQALQQHKEPAMVIAFDNKADMQSMDKVVVIEYEQFKGMLDIINNL